MTKLPNISRAKALSLLSDKRARLPMLIKNSSNEGSFSNHRLAQVGLAHKDILLNNATIIGVRRFRNDRNCWEKIYHVIGMVCIHHADKDSIVYVRLADFHKGLNPCLICMSESDEIGKMSIEYNINKATAHYLKKKRGYDVNQIKEYFALKEELSSSKMARSPVMRENSQYLKNLTLAEKFEKKLLKYSSKDPRKERLIKLMQCLDITSASILQEGKIQFVQGLKCKHHPSVNIEKRQIGRLLEGANPCQECKRFMRKAASKGKARPVWSSQRLVEKIKSDSALSLRLSNFDLNKMKIQFIRKGGRSCAHVCDVICREHDRTVTPLLIAHFLNGKIFCPKCVSSNSYTLSSATEMVLKAHNGIISLVKFSGGVLGNSRFKCNLCKHLWETTLNGVIGSNSKNTYRLPTGCPKCASISNYSENHVESILVGLGYSIKRSGSSVIEDVLPEIISTPMTFARSVSITRNNKRELRIDYLINTGCKIYAIEVDGPHHYGIRFRRHGEDEFKKIHELDCQKVLILSDQYDIQTCRLPLPILQSDGIRSEIINITKHEPRWIGVPDRSWINSSNDREAVNYFGKNG